MISLPLLMISLMIIIFFFEKLFSDNSNLPEKINDFEGKKGSYKTSDTLNRLKKLTLKLEKKEKSFDSSDEG